MALHGPGKAIRVRRGTLRHAAQGVQTPSHTTTTPAAPSTPVVSSSALSRAQSDALLAKDKAAGLTSSHAAMMTVGASTTATRSPRPSPLVASLRLPCDNTSSTPGTLVSAAMAAKLWREQLELYPLLRLVPLQFALEQRYSAWRDAPPSPSLPASNTPGTGSHTTATEANTASTTSTISNGYTCALASCPQLDLSASYEAPRSLRAALWGGCKPDFLRATLWRVLCDYAPTTLMRQRGELQRKRLLYRSYTTYYYDNNDSNNNNNTMKEGNGQGKREEKARQMGGTSSTSVTPPSSETRSAAGEQAGKEVSSTAEGTRAASPFTQPPESPSRWGLATSLTRSERAMQNQIALDLPRHEAALFKCPACAASLARCLFLWAQRHPAVGYVQGMDDIVCVFYELFLSEALTQVAMEGGQEGEQQQQQLKAGMTNTNDALGNRESSSAATQHEEASVTVIEQNNEGHVSIQQLQEEGERCTDREQCAASLSLHLLRRRLTLQLGMSPTVLTRLPRRELEAAVHELPSSYLLQVEADTYWCADRLLGQLQDNFTPGLPGIARSVAQLERLLRRANAGALLDRLAGQGVTLMNGCFQWLHCLLARELPLHLLLSLWDTYFAMGSEDWPRFHLYVCAALLLSLQPVLCRVGTEQVLQLLRSPFAASLAQLTQTSKPVVRRDSEAKSSTLGTSQWQARRAEARREAQWLELLIADAYRLWRLYPNAVQN